MRENINVESTILDQFFTIGNKIVIPEYQRRYDWRTKHTEKLLRDLYNSYEEYIEGNIAFEELGEYFIGNLVFFNNYDVSNTVEVVDGQQRLTTLFLIYRVIIETMGSLNVKNTKLIKERKHFIDIVSSFLWVKNDRTGDLDYSDTIMVTQVIGEDMDEFKNVMGVRGSIKKRQSNHYKNYKIIEKTIKELFTDNYTSEEDVLGALINFLHAINKKTLLLTINTNTRDMALTIFQTINDSGVQLSRVDILKAQIYKKLKEEERKGFISDWNSYGERLRAVGKDMGAVFDIYLEHLKAEDGSLNVMDTEVKRIITGTPELLTDNFYLGGYIESVISFYELVYQVNETDTSIPKSLKKYMHLAMEHPFERLQRTVVIYYIVHGGKSYFKTKFKQFLKEFLYMNIVSGLKGLRRDDMVSLYLNINIGVVDSKNGDVYLNLSKYVHDGEDLRDNIMYKVYGKNTVMGKVQSHLLYLLAYNHPQQVDLIPSTCQIEHILPKEWESNYVPSKTNSSFKKDDETVKSYVECLANKTLFEGKLNASASNNFFKKKKAVYTESKVKITKDLSNRESDFWYVEDIDERRLDIYKEVQEILNDLKTQKPIRD